MVFNLSMRHGINLSEENDRKCNIFPPYFNENRQKTADMLDPVCVAPLLPLLYGVF